MKKIFYKGFSLVEMIVVLIIMGIITSTLIPLLNTKKVKIKAAQRYASEILQVINAEQNYYMQTVDKNTGQHVYTNNLKDLVNKNFLGKIPLNPFYGGEYGKLKIKVNNSAFVNKQGSNDFTLTFTVPKDVLGVFYNSIPGLKTIKEEGNKVIVETTIHIPGLEASLDNLMHRDAGVDQELRTSHGPIQVTDNVNPNKSYIYITDDNTQTPQKIYENDANNISNGHGVVKIGSITNDLGFGVVGGDKNGNLIISANRNKQPGTLELGYDGGKGVGSNKVIIGIGKYMGINVQRGIIYFYGINDQGNNKKIAFMTYLPSQASPNSSWGSYSVFELNNPDSGSSVRLSAFKNKPISTITMGGAERSERMFFDASGDKPISFIGSIGGVFQNISPSEYGSLKSLEGKDCAGGEGTWKLIATGVTSAKIRYKDPGRFGYDLKLNGGVGGGYQTGVYVNFSINFKNTSSTKSLSAIAFNMTGAKGAGIAVEGSHNTPTTVRGKITGTYLLICVPKANGNYDKAVGGFYIKKKALDTNVQY